MNRSSALKQMQLSVIVLKRIGRSPCYLHHCAACIPDSFRPEDTLQSERAISLVKSPKELYRPGSLEQPRGRCAGASLTFGGDPVVSQMPTFRSWQQESCIALLNSVYISAQQNITCRKSRVLDATL